MKSLLLFTSVLTLVLISCNDDRGLIPNTHDGRVPDVINLVYMVDSTVISKKLLVRLSWGYDSLRYGTDREKANLRDWEVYRSFNDTASVLFSSRGRTFFPQFIDSSNEIRPGNRDSVVLFFKVYPAGYTSDNIQFIGKPSDVINVIIRKKK